MGAVYTWVRCQVGVMRRQGLGFTLGSWGQAGVEVLAGVRIRPGARVLEGVRVYAYVLV